MPGSCEADKSSSSNLISSLRSYRLKERTKYQVPVPSTSKVHTNSNIGVPDSSNISSSNSNIEKSSEQNHLKTSSDQASVSSPQGYNPLGYRKYEISHTSQFILPSVLTKFQQALKKNNIALLDVEFKLTEEEYTKLKELVLKQVSLAEKWKSRVIEATSYVTCGARELKVNRQYLTELCKYIRRHIGNPTKNNTGESTTNSPSNSVVQSNTPKPVRTYSRPNKTPKVVPPKPVIQSPANIESNNFTNASPTKGIMDEYEVFCEKEQNLRKLLDAFPGADIMEAQDILVRCSWDLDEAVKVAHAQPLRCSKKKALQYANSNSSTDNISVQAQPPSDPNPIPQPMNSNTNNAPKVTEEIVLDSSDEEFNSIQQMNSKRRNDAAKLPSVKRARKMLSSSESEEENMNYIRVNQHNSNSDVSSKSNAATDVNNVSLDKAFYLSQAMTIKAVPNNTSNTSEQSKPSPANVMPNLPKGLVIMQLGSSPTDRLVSKSDVSVSTNKTPSNIHMVNKKAEVISIPSNSQTDSSLNLQSDRSAQVVRIQPSKNGMNSSKPNAGYTIHKTGTVVSLPAVSKGMSITPVANSTVVATSQNRASIKGKHIKGKRKKYAPSEDEDDDYGNEDIYNSDDSDIEENLTSAHSIVLKFFQEASVEELASIPGCSKKKIEAIQNIRPFSSWVDLVQKLGNDKALSTDLLNGAKKVIDMRNSINKLMAKCQQISLDMEDLVESLKENRESSSDYVAKQPHLLNDKMHLAPYQMLGLNWMILLHNQEVNGILADEMGLGKTIQAISFLAYLKQINNDGPHLIVVPSSTLDNWKQELYTWWPGVAVLVYRGSQESRRELRLQILNDEVEDFNVMITTYNMVTSSSEDRSFFKRLEFHYVIFDEAHMLKNMSSQRYQHLMRIKAPRRFLLTGTPLQNNLVELMSLLIFAMPHMFSGKTEQIKQMFSAVSKTDGNKNSYEKDRIDHAKRIMKPFVLRRLKREVLQDLPAKQDETRRCPMIESQAEKYKKLVDKFSAEVRSNREDGAEKISSSGAGMMMQLRRAANHPLLLRHFYDDDKLLEMSHEIIKEPTHTQSDPNLVFEDMSVMSDFELFKLCKNFQTLKSFIIPEEYILNAGKFKVLDELLPTLIQEGHRILLFSQFTMVLDIIEEYMHIKAYKYLRLDGQTPVPDRQDMIDEFNLDSSILIFLLSTRAGGLGINLTAADTVILHDIDFNPYNDKQAEDRCHRVGQTKDVRVIRFISENTIEEGILQSAKEKLKLERDIHDETETEDNDSASVAQLLRDALGLKNSKS